MIARRIGELWGNLIRLDIRHQLARARISFLVGLASIDEGSVGEAVQTRSGETEFGPARAIGLENGLRSLEPGQEASYHVTLLADISGAGRTQSSDPDGRMRLLVRPRPDIHLPVVEVLPFPVEGTIVTGPGLQDQVVGLPKALHHTRWPVVAGRKLVRHAPDEADLQAAARVDVDHSHFLSHAHGLAPVGDRVAENEQPGPFRLAGKNTHDDRTSRVKVGRRLVVLVDHNLKAQLFGDYPLVNITVVEVGPDLRVVIAVGKRDSDRVVLFRIGQSAIS